MKKYPIAEIFTSPQGEGVYAGVLMTFVRTAGCTVGKRFPKERYNELPHCKYECGGDPDIGHHKDCAYLKSVNAKLPIYTEMCTTYDNRTFECDTNYRKKELLTADEIVARIPGGVSHVCISGGEPLMHDLRELLKALEHNNIMVHIETSGTVHPEWLGPYFAAWICVSPKLGVLQSMLERADEVKFLVDQDFDARKLPEIPRDTHVYIQPINYENTLNKDNVQRVLDLQQAHPSWRISIQLHKVLGVR